MTKGIYGKCHICRVDTLFICSDCQIDFNTSIYICNNNKCRGEHEIKCSFKLREKIKELEDKLAFYRRRQAK